MGHPLMFDAADPVLARVRSICLGLPWAEEKVSHGRPAFFTRKVFCYYGGSEKVDGVWHQHPRSIMFLPDPEDAVSLAQDQRVWVPGYLGASGWLGIDLARADWDEVAELVAASYRRTAPAAAVREFDHGSLH